MKLVLKKVLNSFNFVKFAKILFFLAINVDKAFEQLTKLILAKTKDDDIKYSTVDLSKTEKKNDGCC